MESTTAEEKRNSRCEYPHPDADNRTIEYNNCTNAEDESTITNSLADKYHNRDYQFYSRNDEQGNKDEDYYRDEYYSQVDDYNIKDKVYYSRDDKYYRRKHEDYSRYGEEKPCWFFINSQCKFGSRCEYPHPKPDDGAKTDDDNTIINIEEKNKSITVRKPTENSNTDTDDKGNLIQPQNNCKKDDKLDNKDNEYHSRNHEDFSRDDKYCSNKDEKYFSTDDSYYSIDGSYYSQDEYYSRGEKYNSRYVEEKPCWFFINSICKFGSRCKYPHPIVNNREITEKNSSNPNETRVTINTDTQETENLTQPQDYSNEEEMSRSRDVENCNRDVNPF